MKTFITITNSLVLLFPLFVIAANKPPKVDAGPNTRVFYPTASSTKLTGTGSDIEGPVTFLWTQIGGNTTATISQPTQGTTNITGLLPGLYTFVLTVTDNSNVSRKDTTTVSVFQKMTWTVSGSARQAMVHPPTGGSGAPPVIIAFHGHGGTDTGYSAKGFELTWPEAIVVYPLGLPTLSNIDPNCKQRGWQTKFGEANCRTGVVDQDLKFFDAILVSLKNTYNADLNLVFVHGWSNGGDFIYNALWPGRGSKLAGMNPIGASLDSITGTSGKIPMPLIHTAGTMDERTAFSVQQESTQKVRTLNQCSPSGTLWATGQVVYWARITTHLSMTRLCFCNTTDLIHFPIQYPLTSHSFSKK